MKHRRGEILFRRGCKVSLLSDMPEHNLKAGTLGVAGYTFREFDIQVGRNLLVTFPEISLYIPPSSVSLVSAS